MDVMEAVRQTQMKLDQLVEEVCQVRHLINNLQHQNRYGLHTHPSSAALEQQQSPIGKHDQQVQRQVTMSSCPEGQQGENQHDAKPPLLIIGDSNVRRLEGVSNHVSTSLAFHSISGATSDQVGQDLSQAVRKYKATEVVIHVGANDVTRKGSEEVVRDILGLAQKTKRQGGVTRVYVCSVTPRKDRGSFIFSRTESVNNRLRSLCPTSGISFIDLRPRLETSQFSGLLRDAVHYNKVGSTRALQMIAESVDDFLV